MRNLLSLVMLLAATLAGLAQSSGNRPVVLTGTNTTCNWNFAKLATWSLSGPSTNLQANIPTNSTFRTIYELRVSSDGVNTLDFKFSGAVTTNWVTEFLRTPRNGQTTFIFEQYGNSVDISAVPDVFATADNQILGRASGTLQFAAPSTFGISGSGSGMPIVIANAVAATLGDGATYYYGSHASSTLAQAGTYTNASIRIPANGTLTSAWIRTRQTTVSDGGASATFSIRLNDTTDIPIFTNTLGATVAENLEVFSQAVTTNDYIALKIVTGTWVTTNPVGGWWVTLILTP